MAIKSLQVLYLGCELNRDKGRFTFGVDEGKMVDSAFLGYLIRSDEGNILIDAGFHPDDVAKVVAMGRKLEVKQEDQLPSRLQELGLSLADINIAIMTHLHSDHVGWLAHMKNAEVIVQRDEYKVAIDPPTYTRRLYPSERILSPDIKWKFIDGDMVLMPGITLIFTPGHSAGSQSIMVDLPQSGTILIVGDAGFMQDNFEREIVPFFFADPQQALYSIKRLKVLAQIRNAPIFCSHDMDYWRQHILKSPEAYL